MNEDKNEADDIERPADITGVNHAKAMLGVDRNASDDAIDAAFEAVAADAEGERYWAAVKAREVARSDAVPDGTVVYTLLRDDPTPADLEALTDATDLLDCAPPPTDRRHQNSYERALRRTLETVRERRATLQSTAEHDISDENVRALEVAYHALRQGELAAGKRWVLGPGFEEKSEKNDRKRSDSGLDRRNDLVHGWRYSVTDDGATEYYASPNGETLVRVSTANAPDGPATGCEAVRRADGDVLETRTGRYGEVQRCVKRWILETDAD